MAVSRTYGFATCLSFGDDGEANYIELEVEVAYQVIWGEPMVWGSTPETSHQGSGDEIDDIKVIKIDGKTAPWGLIALPNGDQELADQIEDSLRAKCEEAMLERARNLEVQWGPD
jgi:hypothetical protein